jgi:hypothetical protein
LLQDLSDIIELNVFAFVHCSALNVFGQTHLENSIHPIFSQYTRRFEK